MLGSIIDQTPALADVHNYAARLGFSGCIPEQEAVTACESFYLSRKRLYNCRQVSHFDIDDAINSGLDFGAEFDDLVKDAFEFGSPADAKQAVNCIIDLYLQDKSTAEILADLPYTPHYFPSC